MTRRRISLAMAASHDSIKYFVAGWVRGDGKRIDWLEMKLSDYSGYFGAYGADRSSMRQNLKLADASLNIVNCFRGLVNWSWSCYYESNSSAERIHLSFQ